MKIPKQERIKEIIKLLGFGYEFKDIAIKLNISKSTVYRNYQNFRINTDFIISDILYKVDKKDIQNSLESLKYTDICVLSKKFSCGYWINNKKGKINKLVPFLSLFFYFDLNPISFTKESIKRAYYKKAKQLHPDMTKIDTNKEFSDMRIIYETLLKTIEVMY